MTKSEESGREAGASRAAGGRRKKRVTRKRYSPDEKRATVQAFFQSGHSKLDFRALQGVSPHTLARWISIHDREGPRGFEPKRRARRKHEDPRRLPQSVRAEIARTKQRFPAFGLRKVRDFLARCGGIRVSVGSGTPHAARGGAGRRASEEDAPARPEPAAALRARAPGRAVAVRHHELRAAPRRLSGGPRRPARVNGFRAPLGC